MNTNHLSQIFTNYIEKFEYINNTEHHENYKWIAAKKFRSLMDAALTAETGDFAALLYKAKVSTVNIIDSYITPFNGLVEFARREPETVREMFRSLYADDGGDLSIRQEKIADFFRAADILLDKYTPGSFMYKQDFHAVSSYISLYDPDDNYIFKATQSVKFADSIEFFDDWGSGRTVKLDVYYRMCDMLVSEIMKWPQLLKTDSSRFDGRFEDKPKEMIADEKKHMLAFDLIYCANVYGLYEGVTFQRHTTKERQLYLERQNKAQELLEKNKEAIEQKKKLDEAVSQILNTLCKGTEIRHKKFGDGVIAEINENRITVDFTGDAGRKTLGTAVSLANRLITADIPGFDELCGEPAKLMTRAASINNAMKSTEAALKPYEEYLS